MTLNRYDNLFSLHDPDDYRGGDILSHYENFFNSLHQKGFRQIGRGGTRTVFARPTENFVIKVPHRGDGVIDNIVEHLVWRKYRNKPTSRNLLVAPCRLLPNGALCMVKVIRANPDSARINHPWIDNMADMFQGGYHKDKLVIFDFALETLEREEWESEWGVKSEILHCDGWAPYRAKVLNGELIPFTER